MSNELEARERSRWAGRPLASGVFAVVALARLAYAANRTVFSTFPDEPAQLAMARWLSGGTSWSMFDHSTWQPGFSLLVIPAYWVTDDPEAVYRFALVVNSLLGGVAALLLARLIVRLTPLAEWRASLIAVAIAVLPAGLAASARAWAEPSITVIVLVMLLFALRAIGDGSIRHGVYGVIVAGCGYLVHGRLLPLLPFAFCVLSVVLVRRHRPNAILGGVVFLAAVFGSAELFSGWVRRHVWEDPDRTNTIGSTLERLTRPGAVIDSVVGQTWYLLVATALFGGLGFWVLVGSALGSSHDGTTCRRSDAVVVLGLIMPLIGVSMLFMSGRDSPDQLIYGRYNEAVVWPISAIGLAWLMLVIEAGERTVVSRRLAVTASVSVVLTAVVAIRFGEALRQPDVVRLMIAGVSVLADTQSPVFPWVACGVSLALTAVVVLAVTYGKRASHVGLLLGVAIVLALGVRSWVVLGRNLNTFADNATVRAVDHIVPPGEPLGFKFVPIDEPSLVFLGTQQRLAQLYQMYLPDHRFAVDKGLDDDVGPYVFAPKANEPLVAAGAEMLWIDERSGMALWHEPPGDG